MSSIDTRVVEMKFDNSKFLNGAQSSIEALKKLKDGLALDGAKKGLADVSAEASKFSLANVASGVDSIASKFTALGVIGVTALANIANKAVNVGLDLAKSLSIEPINAGFNEYELKMGSIQTILANTARHGTGLDQVKASLEQLNDYADKTIYNFGDMTRNIGLFTNAGIGIEDSTSMIKGFSNAAAASGTSAQGAAGAAYQLSQALSAGTIRLMDWRSLQNVGMGNKNMQDGLIQLAEAMGQFNDETTSAEEATKDFNGSLENKWLSADVMSKYLKIMAGDMDAAAMSALGLSDAQIASFQEQQRMGEEAATKVRTWTQLIGTLRESVGSSWAETFELLLGDFDSATTFFTKINDTLGPIIGAAGQARNELIRGWSDGGGRDAVIQGLSNSFDILMSVIQPVKDAFREIFPPITVERLIQLSQAFQAFTERMKPSQETLEKFKTIFRGLFSVFDIFGMVISEVLGLFQPLGSKVSEAGGSIFDFVVKIAAWISSVRDAMRTGTGFSDWFDQLAAKIQKPIEWLRQARQAVLDWASSFSVADAASAGTTTVMGALSTVGQKLKDTFSGLGQIFKDLWDGLKQGFKGFDMNSLLSLLGGAGVVAGGIGIKKLFDSLTSIFKDNPLNGLKDTIKSTFGALTDTLSTMQNTLKSATLLGIAVAIGVLVASLSVLASIDPDKMNDALVAMAMVFTQLMVAMAAFEKIATGASAVKMVLMAGGLILLATSVLILTHALENLSGLSWDELLRGLAGLAGILVLLAGTTQLISSQSKSMVTTGAGLLLIAVGVRILVSAVTDLSGLSWEELAKGLVAVGTLLSSLALFTRFAETGKASLGQAAGILLLAVSIKMLVGVVQEFSTFSWEEIAKGLTGLTGILVALGVFTQLTDTSGIVKTGVAMVILGAAMHIMASAVSKFAAMSWEDLAKGLGSTAVALGVISAAVNTMPKDVLVKAVALIAISFAVGKLADSLTSLGGMSWDEIARGLVAFAGAMVVVVGAVALMQNFVAGALALSVLTLALSAFLPVIITLGQTPISVLATGLGMLAAVFVVLGVAGLLLTPIVPTLLALGVAMTLMGVAALALGVGIFALGAGFGLFVTALLAFVGAGSAAVAALSAIFAAIIAAIPGLMAAVGDGIVQLAVAIGNGAPQIVDALVKILLSLIDAIGTVVPPLLDALSNLITQLCDHLVTLVPKLVDSGLKIILGILEGFNNNLPQIVDAGGDLIVNLLEGLGDKIPDIVTAAGDLIVDFINALGDSASDIVDAGADMIIKVVEGLGQNASDVADAASDTVADFLESLESTIRRDSARISAAGRGIAIALIDGLTGGLASRVGNAVASATATANSIVNGVKGVFRIASPSKVFYGFGVFLNEGLARGIDSSAAIATNSVTRMGNKVVDAMANTMSGLDLSASGSLDIQPTIRPVLDLSDVRRNATGISGILANSMNLADLDEIGNTQNTSERGSNVTNFEFKQYNTSPKALSPTEVYRLTNNQLSQIKEALPV